MSDRAYLAGLTPSLTPARSGPVDAGITERGSLSSAGDITISGSYDGTMARNRSQAPVPGSTLVDEGGATNCWLDADWSFDDIRYEWDWMFDEGRPVEDQLNEIWFSLRWASAEQRADEDLMFDLFGDHELNGVDTSVIYTQVKPGTAGAHKYWTSD